MRILITLEILFFEIRKKQNKGKKAKVQFCLFQCVESISSSNIYKYNIFIFPNLFELDNHDKQPIWKKR